MHSAGGTRPTHTRTPVSSLLAISAGIFYVTKTGIAYTIGQQQLF